jgi:hypothetical protein
MMSRVLSKDEWSRRFQVFTAVGHIAYPSWCLAVKTMYRCPVSLACLTIALASNFDGLNFAAPASYTDHGMLHRSLIHSASRQIVPSGCWYSPPQYV